MKNILLTLLVLSMVSGIAIAPPVPYPIAVKITANNPIGLDVEITDVNLGISKIYQTNEFGEIMLDASDFIGFKQYDTFQAKVLICKDSIQCVKTDELVDSLFFQFDLTGIITPTCPEPIVCPIVPTCEELGYIKPTDCPTIPVCEECPESVTCPDTTEETIITFIFTIIISLGAGYGFKVYVDKEGKVKGLHKHSGIISYHDPNITHLNPLIRHPKGKFFVKYKKDSDGKWRYLG